MPSYDYKAVDKSGRPARGGIEAVNEVDLELRLRRMGLDLITYQQVDRQARTFTARGKITRQDLGGGTTVMSDVTLPAGYTFAFPPGIADTPDGFLPGSSLYVSIGTTGTAVYLGAGTTGTFLGDGTFVDNSNVLLNGSVFTMGSGNGTARGITLAGSAGRVKQYWLQSSAWKGR